MKKRIIIPFIIVFCIGAFFYFIFPNLISENNESEIKAAVCIYLQDPENGEYIYAKKTYSVISEDKISYTPTQKPHYEIDEEKSILSANTLDNVEFKVYYKCKIYKVTFSGDGGRLVSGNEEQSLRAGQKMEKPVYQKDGYSLVGFKNKLFDGVLSADETIYEDSEYIAVWVPIEKE